VFDHVAIGTRNLNDGWELFSRLLGGRWAYGADTGFWWGQLKFAGGAKIELLKPTAGAGSAFLERFLDSRGAGPHHFNFIVPDIVDSLDRVRALGIEPTQVNLDSPQWKEAFLHPKNVFGIVVQIAQQASEPVTTAPADLPEPGTPSSFVEAVHHVDDLEAAIRLFGGALCGEQIEQGADGSVLLEWPNGARLRLMPTTAASGLHHLEFARSEGAFSAAERAEIGTLANRLGVTLQLN
jgi:methylmalonyl-CoA/ethylmalonyl-CoA epimerase